MRLLSPSLRVARARKRARVGMFALCLRVAFFALSVLRVEN